MQNAVFMDAKGRPGCQGQCVKCLRAAGLAFPLPCTVFCQSQGVCKCSDTMNIYEYCVNTDAMAAIMLHVMADSYNCSLAQMTAG